MLRLPILSLLALAGATAHANSTFDLTLREEAVTFRFNANELRCDPGSSHGFQIPTRIELDLPSPMFDIGSNGQRYVMSNVHLVTRGDRPGSCGKIAHLVNQPNPNWRLAHAKRVVKERYYQVSSARCDKSLVEELTITIDGEADLELTGTHGFFVESVAPSRCAFAVER